MQNSKAYVIEGGAAEAVMHAENDILVGSAGISSWDHFECVEGVRLWVPRGVFCPGVSVSSQLMAAALTDVANKDVLDLGTGSGFLAIVAATRGARLVIATDIDLRAAVAARRNADLNQLGRKIRVVASDLFAGLRPVQFDMIVANLPLRPSPDISLPIPNGQRSLVDEDHGLLKQFLGQGALFLKRRGNLLFVMAPFSRKMDIMDYAATHGWHIETTLTGDGYEIWHAKHSG